MIPENLKKAFSKEVWRLFLLFKEKKNLDYLEVYELPWKRKDATEEKELYLDSKSPSIPIFGFILNWHRGQGEVEIYLSGTGIVDILPVKGIRDLKKTMRGLDLGRWLV